MADIQSEENALLLRQKFAASLERAMYAPVIVSGDLEVQFTSSHDEVIPLSDTPFYRKLCVKYHLQVIDDLCDEIDQIIRRKDYELNRRIKGMQVQMKYTGEAFRQSSAEIMSRIA